MAASKRKTTKKSTKARKLMFGTKRVKGRIVPKNGRKFLKNGKGRTVAAKG